MKKVVPLFLLLTLFSALKAQDEQLNSLKFNAVQYYKALRAQPAHPQLKYLIGNGNIVVNPDTLILPFIDDFTQDRTPGFDYFTNHITDTFYNVIGGCLLNEGVTTVEGIFLKVPSYTYFFNTTTHAADSVRNPGIPFTNFGTSPGNCFLNTPTTDSLWLPYYFYNYDTSGFALDSTAFDDPTAFDTVNYAPVLYFAQGKHGTLWFDNYAYINNTYPLNPPSIGVATLDGLNQYGLPYENNTAAFGSADVLTSNPINISPFNESDSVYLSFFYEPQGNGDYPDVGDSLIVEFRDNAGEWNQVWFDLGYSDGTAVPDTFRQALIKVPTLQIPLNYFTSTFQFRFRNVAALYGSNNHWHIDYVKLDRNRSQIDSTIHDMAFEYPFPTILKNYTLEPADQFIYPDDLTDSLFLVVRNNDPNALTNPPATNFNQYANEIFPTPAIVSTGVVQAFNAQPVNYILSQPKTEYTGVSQSPNWPVDSLVITSIAYINPNDSRLLNDTIKHNQVFTSVMAYDDGSAEKAYGLTGLGVKKFALEFNLNHPDTLAAFQVMFNQVEGSVSDLVFNFEIWDSVKLNDINFTDAPIYTRINQKPFYVDSINGFATFRLDSPIIVSNKVYLGIAQTDTRRVQVGFDVNSPLGSPHMYIFTNGTWKKSQITTLGSPMMRLILSGNWWGQTSSGITDIAQGQYKLSLFPNPTNGLINLYTDEPVNRFDIEVYNEMGQQVKYMQNISNSFDISNVTNGIYIVVCRNTQSGNTYHARVIKTGAQ